MYLKRNKSLFLTIIIILGLINYSNSKSNQNENKYRISEIYINNKDVFDSTQNDWFWGAKVLNKLHTITQPFIIEDELLFSSDDYINL